MPARNIQVSDVVCVRDEYFAPTKWPLARILNVYSGQDGQVNVSENLKELAVRNPPLWHANTHLI